MKAVYKLGLSIGALALCVSIAAPYAFAMDNGVYTDTVHTHYRHPQTGVIEDSGGEKSEKVGQGMTEGAISKEGLFESFGPNSAVTIRIVLMDAVSNVSFSVNDAAVTHELTQSGTLPNGGNFGDFRIPVSSTDDIVRCRMFVEPMGRDVVFYMTFSDFVPGQGNFVVSDPREADPLYDSRSSALRELEALAELSEEEKQEFTNTIQAAESEAAITEGLSQAQEADKQAQALHALKIAQSEALQKIDEMNFDQAKARSYKDKIRAAQSVDEINKILASASSPKYIWIGLAAAVLVGLGALGYVGNKRKRAQAKKKEQ